MNRVMKMRLALPLSLLLALTACGDDGDSTKTDTGTDTSSATDTTTTDSATSATDSATSATDSATSATDTATSATDTATDTAASCDHNGFTAVSQDASILFGALLFIGQSTASSPVDTLNFELVADKGGATTAGTYTLTDDGYADCGNCVLVWQGCDDNLDNCQKTFLANAGTLTITSIGESGAKLTGTLSDATLVEVTIDDETFVSTPVAGGETWCIDSFAFDVDIQ